MNTTFMIFEAWIQSTEVKSKS